MTKVPLLLSPGPSSPYRQILALSCVSFWRYFYISKDICIFFRLLFCFHTNIAYITHTVLSFAFFLVKIEA